MLTLHKAGIYSTVQDSGRFQGSHLGVPCSGPMDRQSADLANLILGNHENDALLECTFQGPTIEFSKPTTIAIAGAVTIVYLNDNIIDPTIPIQITPGDILTFGKFDHGCRVYMAIKGGIQSELVYGSRSTCFTAGILRPLKKGDQLEYNPTLDFPTSTISIKRNLLLHSLSASKGPEFSILDDSQQKQLLKTQYKVLPSSNRMAFRVSHTSEITHSYSMLSSGTMPGTVQLTPSGEMIFLMRDCQTTGGYPRIFQLTEKSICDLSQLSPTQIFTLNLDV